jgi:hypothetical protein
VLSCPTESVITGKGAPGPRLICRVHHGRAGGTDRRKGFTEIDYARRCPKRPSHWQAHGRRAAAAPSRGSPHHQCGPCPLIAASAEATEMRANLITTAVSIQQVDDFAWVKKVRSLSLTREVAQTMAADGGCRTDFRQLRSRRLSSLVNRRCGPLLMTAVALFRRICQPGDVAP